MNNGYEHASQCQLFLCAYPHGKRVMPLACERVITCCVRAFTLFLEIPWRVTNYTAQKILKSKIWNPQESSDHTCHLKSGVPLLELFFFFKVIKLPPKILAKIILPKKILKSKIWNPQKSSDHTCHLKSREPLLVFFFHGNVPLNFGLQNSIYSVYCYLERGILKNGDEGQLSPLNWARPRKQVNPVGTSLNKMIAVFTMIYRRLFGV